MPKHHQGKYTRISRKDVTARPVAKCPDCGKQAYAGRKPAKTAARRLFPGEQMRVYQCGSGNGYWHMTSQSTEQTTGIRAYLAELEDTGPR